MALDLTHALLLELQIVKDIVRGAALSKVVSDRTEPDMSFELFEPDKSPVQLNPDFWPEPMNRTI